MKMIHKQLSEEWFAERKGKLTASNFGAAAGINPYKSRQKLWRELTGREEPFAGNERTQYGVENEQNAIRDYEVFSGQLVIPTGFHHHGEHAHIGASPDGLLLDGGTIEVKCRFDQTLHKEIPIYYLAQCYGVMACTNSAYCEFISWAPGELNVIRVHYEQAKWEALLELLNEFWEYVKTDIEPKRLKKTENIWHQ